MLLGSPIFGQITPCTFFFAVFKRRFCGFTNATLMKETIFSSWICKLEDLVNICVNSGCKLAKVARSTCTRHFFSGHSVFIKIFLTPMPLAVDNSRILERSCGVVEQCRTPGARPWVRAPLVPTCLCPWERYLRAVERVTLLRFLFCMHPY